MCITANTKSVYISQGKIVHSRDLLDVYSRDVPQLPYLRAVVIRHKEFALAFEQGIPEPDMVFSCEVHILVEALRIVVRRIAVEEAVRSVVELDECLEVSVLNGYGLQSCRGSFDERKLLPHRNGAAAVLVCFVTVAVLYKVIEFRGSVIVTESSEKTSPALLYDTAEVITGVYHKHELFYELSGVLSDAAVKVHKIAVGIVENLEFLRCFMEQHPACASENLNIPLIFKRKTYYYLVAERFLTSHP